MTTLETPQASANFEQGRQAIFECFERQNFVREAPIFSEQIQDTTRTNIFAYGPKVIETLGVPLEPKPGDPTVTMTEYEGLNALHGFLTAYLEYADTTRYIPVKDWAPQARDILNNLTFIGGNEYREAAAWGLPSYWKAYLEENPKNQLCVLAEISRQKNKRKSDIHLLENILDNFGEAELTRYNDRFVGDVAALHGNPDNTKIVLLDDWIVSGEQLMDALEYSSNPEALQRYSKCIEINLVVANEERISRGIGPYRTPIKAYYRTPGDNKIVTGTHCSADYFFAVAIGRMVWRSNEAKDTSRVVAMPPLTNIVRTYRNEPPRIAIRHDGTFQKLTAQAAPESRYSA